MDTFLTFLPFLCESLTTIFPNITKSEAKSGCQIPARQRPKRKILLLVLDIRSYQTPFFAMQYVHYAPETFKM